MATSANVVLPAPGVATARKLVEGLASKRARASRCHARNRTPSVAVDVAALADSLEDWVSIETSLAAPSDGARAHLL